MPRETPKKNPRDDVRKRVLHALESSLQQARPGGIFADVGSSTRDDKIEARFAAETGFWEKGAEHKPPRWFVHFDPTGGAWSVSAPRHAHGLRIGFANISGGKTTGITVRVVPAVKLAPRRFELVENWEWLLFFCLAGPMIPTEGGNSSVVFKFNPMNGELHYEKGGRKGAGARDLTVHELEYVTAGLVGLCPPTETLAPHLRGGEKVPALTYGDATTLLASYLHISERARVKEASP